MDFEEAQKRFAELTDQHRRSAINVQQYRNAVNLLRVQDPSGRWWQVDPGTGGWLYYEGNQWRPGTPPAPAPSARQPSPAPPPTQVTLPVTPPPTPPHPHADNKLMDMEEFKKISKTQPWHKRPQKWWDLFSILGGIASAIIWFLYSSVRSSIEGFDLLSPILMIGIPIFLVMYRAQLDDVLVPLQPHRKKVPKLVLVGAGIAVPFLTAFILYNLVFIRNYPLMHWNMIIGTFAAYAITREPILAKGYQAAKGLSLKVPLVFFVVCSVIFRIVNADHCLTDPLNAQDCLRSQGFAEAIAGTASAGASTAINGPEIVRTLTQQQPPPGEGGAVQETSPPELPEQTDDGRPPGFWEDWKRRNEEGFEKNVESWREADGTTYYDRKTDTFLSREIAQDVARERAESALQEDMGRRLDGMKDSILFGDKYIDPSRSDVMVRAIDRMLEQIKAGEEVSLDQYNRLYQAWGRDIKGQTVPPSQMPPEYSTAENVADTIWMSGRELITGKDDEGKTSWLGIGGRVLIDIATGGGAEWVFTPGNTVYTANDYVMKEGGDSALEVFRRSARDAVIAEGIGRAAGWVMEGGKIIASEVAERLAEKFPRGAEIVSEVFKDIKNFWTKERHLFSGADDTVKGISEASDDVVKSAARESDEASHGISSEADDAAAAARRGKPKPAVPETEEEKIWDLVKKRQAGQADAAGIKKVEFEPGKKPPDIDGLTARDRKGMQMLGNKHNAEPVLRPRPADAAQKIKNGESLPKREYIKSKTVTGDDASLGFSNKRGQVAACKEPAPLPDTKPADMADDVWARLKQRHGERTQDWLDHRAELQRLRGEKVIKWDGDKGGDGIIYDYRTGKTFVPDTDVYAWVDPVTKKPVSPWVSQQINREAQAMGLTEHGDHLSWNFRDKMTAGQPPGTPPNPTNPDFLAAKHVDDAIIAKHAPGGTPLSGYDSVKGKWESLNYSGSERDFTGT